jgi:hypothetical protein
MTNIQATIAVLSPDTPGCDEIRQFDCQFLSPHQVKALSGDDFSLAPRHAYVIWVLTRFVTTFPEQ